MRKPGTESQIPVQSRTHAWKLTDIPLNPNFFNDSGRPTTQSTLLSKSSLEIEHFLAPAPLDNDELARPPTASFRIRAAAPKIDLLKHKYADIFRNFDEFLRGMVERGEDVESEAELYLKLLSEHLGESVETIKNYTRIDIVADTSTLTLQAFGEALTQLAELRLSGSTISSVRDIGTSFKSLKVLWLSRVGLRDLAGLLAFQGLEELYASYNFVSDLSDIPYAERLHTLDLEANEISDLQQLSYISPSLKTITLAGNKVAAAANYLSTLMEYGRNLELIDDMPVPRIMFNNTVISSPTPKGKKATDLSVEDGKLVERLRSVLENAAVGLAEDMIRESISTVDGMLHNEPEEEEILRQSIKVQSFKGEKKGKLKAAGKENEMADDVSMRPATASTATTLKYHKELAEPRIEGYSALVTNTDKVFVGNPLKAAKHKKQCDVEHFQKLDIYSLIDRYKDVSPSLKTRQASKKTTMPITILTPTAGNAEGSIRIRGMINIKKLRCVKKP